MNNRLIYILFIFSICSYSQDDSKPIIYINEELEQIDETTYYQNVLKTIYREEKVIQDSLVIKRLIKTYDFGYFNETELPQIQNALKKYLNIKEFDKSIILVFQDSILGFSHYKKSQYLKKEHDELDNSSEKKYLERRIGFDERQKKCVKFAKKNNAIPKYVYSRNVDFNLDLKHHTKEKIPDFLKNIFFKNLKQGLIILKPNGHYFYYTRLTQAMVKKMLETDWEPYIKEFNAVKNNTEKYSLQFIDKMYIDLEKEMKSQAMRRVKQIQNERRKTNSTNQNRRISGRFPVPNCYVGGTY
ncbi:hypothetical protein [Winogradskyella sp. 4-2091]|uniref:hypothetical protein n=1 Tax=Winogradskyella sp. 4-2091 TaxID=3381659 RepID=UPI0038911E7E